MAKFVIAGCADCPYYARAELLADNLQTNLPDFRIHKIVKNTEEWEMWLAEVCKTNGWIHKKSPIVWRELIDRGGKGTLIGGCNEFQEYAWGYYGIKSQMLSNDMTQVGSENMETHLIVTAEKEFQKSLSKPLNICVTNATSPVAYSMINELCQGHVLGTSTELSIKFFVKDNEEVSSVEGVKMESLDLAYPLLRKAEVTPVLKDGLNNCELLIILDDLSQKADESWEDWIIRAGEVYFKYGRIVAEVAKQDLRIVIGGVGPRNFGAYMLKHATPNLPSKNIVVPLRLQENRAKAAIARHIKVNSAGVVDIVVWGNIGGSIYTDVTRARVHGCEGAIWGPPTYSRPVREMVHDDKWLQTEYLDGLANHKQNLINCFHHEPSVSEAHSIISLLCDWWNGSKEGQIYSLGVPVSGQYGISDGLFFSLPVRFQPGNWEVIDNLQVTEEDLQKLKDIEEELKKEIAVIFPSAFQLANEGSDNKVFGTESEGTKESENKSDVTENQEENNLSADVARIGLTRILEESESESKEGTTVGTDK